MPRWVLGAIAAVALAYAGVITYAYEHERQKHDVISQRVFDANYLEAQLPLAQEHKDQGTLSGVVCVQRSSVTFKCVGKLTPSLKVIHQEHDPADGGILLGADARALQRQEATDVSYTVTMDTRTGKFVTGP